MSHTDEQFELIPHEDEVGPDDVFPSARRSGSGEGRGRGRPKGAKNKKTEQLQKLWNARGFKDPLMFQGEFLSSHPADLWRWFVKEQAKVDGLDLKVALQKALVGKLPGVPTIPEIVAMQLKTADHVAPYLHGKMPVREESDDDERLPVLMIDLGTDQVNEGKYLDAAEEPMSIGAQEPSSEGQTQRNQRVSGDDE
ncbi:hypothetical protein [Pseudovibrio sp. POLY-S9]|uniref:hypothetical protein n=1 Tax=Pseudovibrio sp. POLY-S9 TaxID=1576596 RepID=UPI0007091207|nr:hypothetical protein [Pseudovibrio sp. POLY-S9]